MINELKTYIQKRPYLYLVFLLMSFMFFILYLYIFIIDLFDPSLIFEEEVQILSPKMKNMLEYLEEKYK